MNPARVVFPAIRWTADQGFAGGMEEARAAVAEGVGGFIIFGGPREDVASLTQSLRDLARERHGSDAELLFAADLERGAGQQFRGLTELPPPLALASFEGVAAAERAAALTAQEARSVGVDWVLAPVADLDVEAENPIVGTRAFGGGPQRVARLVGAWVRGCQRHALACAKHYPGHGRTVVDSHVGVPRVDASAAELELDRTPFSAAVAGGVAGIMTAHVAFPALDPTRTPATFSGPIQETLRASGFPGVLMTDALMMEGAQVAQAPGEVALRALHAGIDLLLYPREPLEVVRDLRRRTDRDGLVAARIEASVQRIDAAVRRVARLPVTPTESPDLAAHLARGLLGAGLVRGRPPRLSGPISLRVLDDDLDGDYPPSSSAVVREALEAAGLPLGGPDEGARVLLVFAEPRAGKGRGGFGSRVLAQLEASASTAHLIVLFAHPRLLAAIPGQAPVLLAWHRQALMQRAVAAWIRERHS